MTLCLLALFWTARPAPCLAEAEAALLMTRAILLIQLIAEPREDGNFNTFFPMRLRCVT
jgi:hypothetical protein